MRNWGIGAVAALGMMFGAGYMINARSAGAQATSIVEQGKGFQYGAWQVAGFDGGPIPVVPTVPTSPMQANPCGYDDAGGYSIGGDAGAGTIVVCGNDGGLNHCFLCNLTVNTPVPSGVEVICGPSANGCAVDGGVGSTQNVLGNYYFSGPGINANGAPFAYICPKAGDSMCIFEDGGAGWDSLPGFGP